MESGNNRDHFEKSEPIKEESCKSAVVLGIVGAVAGLFIPFIGITFAVAGIYVNSAEKKYYETRLGYKVNFISIGVSLASWVIALALRPLIT